MDLTKKQVKDLANRFTYHPPQGDQTERYEVLRNTGLALAEQIMGLTPPSREQSLALTNVEQAIMWANAAIARQPVVAVPVMVPLVEADRKEQNGEAE